MNFTEMVDLLIDATRARDSEALSVCKDIIHFEGNFTGSEKSILIRLLNLLMVTHV